MPRHLVARLVASPAACLVLFACGSSDVPPPTDEVEPAIIGSACGDNVACEPVAQCLTFLPGGFCSVDCSADATCPGDSLCRVFAQGSFCVPRCDDNVDCRNGYQCTAIAGDDGEIYRVCDAAP